VCLSSEARRHDHRPPGPCRQIAGILGYGEHELTGENTMKVYARYGIDLNKIPELRF
jgi:hypothetical protein